MKQKKRESSNVTLDRTPEDSAEDLSKTPVLDKNSTRKKSAKPSESTGKPMNIPHLSKELTAKDDEASARRKTRITLDNTIDEQEEHSTPEIRHKSPGKTQPQQIGITDDSGPVEANKFITKAVTASQIRKRQPKKMSTVDTTTKHDPERTGLSSKLNIESEMPASCRMSASKLEKFNLLELFHRSMKETEYYHGFLGRVDAIPMLLKNGDYLIRRAVSSREKEIHRYYLSVRTMNVTAPPSLQPKKKSPATLTPRAVSKKPSAEQHVMPQPAPQPLVLHRPFSCTEQGFFMKDRRCFQTVASMIAFLKVAPERCSIRYKLITPVNRAPGEFFHSDVQLDRVMLGEGAYGEVRLGTIVKKPDKVYTSGLNLTVAVKMFKSNNNASMIEGRMEELLTEARLLRLLSHPNVVKLVGIAVLDYPIYIMLEYCGGGSLKNMLKLKGATLTVAQKTEFVVGAARGIEYLHKHNVVHRDIAARNCLLTNDSTLKISDFGLSRLGEYKLTGMVKLPMKWLAPETMDTFVFNMKSDVFSFGILMFEIYANGEDPYKDVSSNALKKMYQEGKIIRLPESAPPKIADFVHSYILIKDPTPRKQMWEIVSAFHKIQQGTPSTLRKEKAAPSGGKLSGKLPSGSSRK